MFLRYRLSYGSGRWSHWHETVGTEDDAETTCGLRHLPVHRIESKERKPQNGVCANCEKFHRLRATGLTRSMRRTLARRKRAAGQGCAKPQHRR